MQKVINAHCHIYPEKIAARAVEGIKKFYDLDMSLNGMTDDLIRDGSEVGAIHYLVHSVATTPEQVRSINSFISEEVRSHPDIFTGFGTLHPDSEDLESDIDELVALGLKGVKLHPDFQQFALNSDKAYRIGEALRGRDLPILVHCGDPRYEFSNPDQFKPFLELFPDITVIGAHFGGWSMFDEAADKLAGTDNLYVDCSSSLYLLEPDEALKLIRRFGADRVLWATDYPMWEAKAEMARFKKIGLTTREEELILYENAARLLKIDEYK